MTLFLTVKVVFTFRNGPKTTSNAIRQEMYLGSSLACLAMNMMKMISIFNFHVRKLEVWDLLFLSCTSVYSGA